MPVSQFEAITKAFHALADHFKATGHVELAAHLRKAAGTPIAWLAVPEPVTDAPPGSPLNLAQLQADLARPAKPESLSAEDATEKQYAIEKAAAPQPHVTPAPDKTA